MGVHYYIFHSSVYYLVTIFSQTMAKKLHHEIKRHFCQTWIKVFANFRKAGFGQKI